MAFGKCIIKLLTILTVYQRTISFLRQLMASYLLTVLTYHKNHISKQLFARVYVFIYLLNRDPDIKKMFTVEIKVQIRCVPNGCYGRANKIMYDCCFSR